MLKHKQNTERLKYKPEKINKLKAETDAQG